jgi:predicted porin
LEREDPAGLYTFSRAYNDAFNFGNVDAFSREGVAFGYSTGDLSLGVSIDQENDENLNNEDINFEISASYTGVENLSLNVGWRTESDDAGDADYTNINATYSVGKALLAAEWSNIDNEATGNDDDAYLILVDYDFTDVLGGAIRYSEYEDGANEVEMFTIAPNYALTDSLGVILEYSDIENAGADDDLLAVELTYTF